MTVDAMRSYIVETYNSNMIRGRNVCDMHDDQVKAIYFSLRNRGTKPVKKLGKKDIQAEQLNFFNLLGGKQNV